MKRTELIEEINTELSNLDITVKSIKELYRIIADKEPDKFQKAAVNQFIMEFYSGVENILKRICRAKNIEIPSGGDSHISLFKLFCEKGNPDLPVIFTKEIEDEYIKIRKFRHFVIHGYSFKVDWSYLKDSVKELEVNYNTFKQIIKKSVM